MSPIRVDFYLATDPDSVRYWTLVCRLIDKAYTSGHQILVYCEEQTQCVYLDEHLWAYQADAFIPHACLHDPIAKHVPVCITTPDSSMQTDKTLLMNLSQAIITQGDKLRRIIEVIPLHEEKKAAARERFRHYRTQGFTLHTHTI